MSERRRALVPERPSSSCSLNCSVPLFSCSRSIASNSAVISHSPKFQDLFEEYYFSATSTVHTSTIATIWYAPVSTPYAIGLGIFGLMAMFIVFVTR